MINRREFLGSSVLGVCVAPWVLATDAKSAWKFFTPDEALVADAMAEQIIPADQDPGAHDLGVVFFMDNQLTTVYARFQEDYRKGLEGVEETSHLLFSRSFCELEWDQQTELLKKLETGKSEGKIWEQRSPAAFFRLIRDHAMQGFYGSPRHGGNRGYGSYKMLGLDYPQFIGQNRYR
jgi:gluconate 2-dehydrogenase gamma chain